MRTWILLLILLPLAVPVWAAVPGLDSLTGRDSVSSEDQAQETEPQKEERDFPGIGEVLPRLSRLQDDAAGTSEQITDLNRIREGLAREIARIEARLERLRNRKIDLGATVGWSVYRLEEVSGRLEEIKGHQRNLSDNLAAWIKKLEEIRQDWGKKKSFWQQWRQELTQEQAELPDQAFPQATRKIEEVLAQANQAITPLLQQQRELLRLQNESREISQEIQRSLQQETFQKTAPTFFEPRFYKQFGGDLWRVVGQGIRQVEPIDVAFLQSQGWLVGLQFFLALGIGGILRRYRREAETAEEWEFILDHPWSTGIFAAFSALGFFYSYPPSTWSFLQWVLGAFSASVLLAALLRDREKIFLVILIGALFILSLALQLINLPQPLYRLYLAVISLAGIPLLLRSANRLRPRQEKAGGFVTGLYAGVPLLALALLAQVAGYSVLAFRLFESSIKTVFLILLAAMVIRLGQGAIDFVMDQRFLLRWRFFRKYGAEISDKLKKLFKVVVLINALIYLVQVWNIYDTAFQAWQDLLDLGFSVGEFELTLKMVLVVLAVLYLSILASWVIRSVLEAELFPRQKIDRGLRDSIKRLLHYTMVLAGFILALVVAGVDLQNFAVVAGAFSIGIGFGLQNIVNNFVSGLILLFERPVKMGDMIIVDEEWGTVKKIGLRSTIVTTLDESEIIVPNSMLISEKVTNWSLSSPLARIVVPVGVAYGSDVGLVLKILNEVRHEIPEILEDPPPSPLFKGFGDSSLDFELRVWIADVRDRLRVRSEICGYIDQRFREEEVTIPFPQRDLHLRSVDPETLGSLGRNEEAKFPEPEQDRAGDRASGPESSDENAGARKGKTDRSLPSGEQQSD